MMYKHSNDLLPPTINDLYVSNNDVHKYSTRQKHLLYIHETNINVYVKIALETQVYGMFYSQKLILTFKYIYKTISFWNIRNKCQIDI